MTPLETVLAFVLLVSAIIHFAQARMLDAADAKLDHVYDLYIAAVAQLEAVTADRDGWRRLVSAVRDGRK